MKTLYAIASRLGGPGIGAIAAHAAEGLAHAGHLKRLACMGHERTTIDRAIVRDVAFLPDRARRLLSDPLYYEMKNRRFDRRVRAFLEEGFDALHAWNSQATRAIHEAKRLGVRVVLDRASTHINTQTRILREAYRRRGIAHEPTPGRVISRCLEDYGHADLVLVPSEVAYRSFVEEKFPESRLALIPFGVDCAPEDPQATQDDRRPFRVLFVGQVGVRKGVFELLEAWDALRLPDAELTLVGGIEPAARKKLAAWKGRADVVFAGFSRDVAVQMARSHVFCFPSLEEGSALVTYEAMRHGLPMITTREAGSVAEEEVSALFVHAGDVHALGDAITRLRDDADLAAHLGRAARERVLPYTWTAYGEAVARAHERLGA